MNDGPYTCYKTEVFLTFISNSAVLAPPTMFPIVMECGVFQVFRTCCLLKQRDCYKLWRNSTKSGKDARQRWRGHRECVLSSTTRINSSLMMLCEWITFASQLFIDDVVWVYHLALSTVHWWCCVSESPCPLNSSLMMLCECITLASQQFIDDVVSVNHLGLSTVHWWCCVSESPWPLNSSLMMLCQWISLPSQCHRSKE